jgi:hypothetical protein
MDGKRPSSPISGLRVSSTDLETKSPGASGARGATSLFRLLRYALRGGLRAVDIDARDEDDRLAYRVPAKLRWSGHPASICPLARARG